MQLIMYEQTSHALRTTAWTVNGDNPSLMNYDQSQRRTIKCKLNEILTTNR